MNLMIIGSVVLNSETNSTKLLLHTFILQNLAFSVLNEIDMEKNFFKYSENLLSFSKNL